ncbi:MAG: XdhC family protein [Pseudomonadales bacterium]|jgi:xanthine dehydrogenase accessory factor|nr:XdhC family protein [Pseudomonadales bacterium]
MNSLDQQVLSQLLTWLNAGRRAWLCTIVETFGSSPRPVGSLLACCEDGRYAGSLSGGCVEDTLREALFSGELASSKPALMRYGVTVEDVLKLGLPCGGSLEVLIEPLTPEHAPLYAELAAKVARRELICRRVDTQSGACTLLPATHHAPLRYAEGVLLHTYGPAFQLLLIGAVQVAWYLAEMAQALDFHVEICDPRQELVAQAPLKHLAVVAAMPDDWLRGKQLDQHTAVIALCHDPRIDDMALLEALPSQAFYVGAMGSSRTSAKRRERLLALDLSAEQLARLHAPVGLELGSKTPPEIAIAILAELIQLRAPLRSGAA